MKLNQVTLKSRDVVACAEFYERLGFSLIVDSRPRYVRFECPDGGAKRGCATPPATSSCCFMPAKTGVSRPGVWMG